MRIWSPGQTGKSTILQLVKLRSDLSRQNLVQNRNQRLGSRHVLGINVSGANGVSSSVPGRDKAGHGVLVEDVEHIKVKGKSVLTFLAKPVIVRP